MSMKKIFASLLASSMALAAFTGCSGANGGGASAAPSAASSGGASAAASSDANAAPAEESGAAIEVEFFQQKMEEGPQKGYSALIEAFSKEYPNITIKMNTVPDAGKVLTSRIASGDIPPVFSDYPTQMQFKQKVENGFIEKLSGQEFLSRVNPSAIDMSKANDGETYALPLSNNFMGVYYNTEIFEQNGLTIPTTFDELITVCETLKGKGVTPLGLTYKDPGRVGHMFQAMMVAWSGDGIETVGKASAGEVKVSESAGIKAMAEKMLKLTSYANEDAFGVADTAMWENFANGKYAMCITGSYARGTILIANPDLKMGVFPLPNDTVETTNILTGVDAAVCISARASEAEKDAGLKFLEFISRTENAQVFCDADGAPSCITAVNYKDEGVQPVIDMIKSGQVHDWMASTINNNVVTDLYNVTQGFLMDKNVEQYLADMDQSIEINSAE